MPTEIFLRFRGEAVTYKYNVVTVCLWHNLLPYTKTAVINTHSPEDFSWSPILQTRIVANITALSQPHHKVFIFIFLQKMPGTHFLSKRHKWYLIYHRKIEKWRFLNSNLLKMFIWTKTTTMTASNIFLIVNTFWVTFKSRLMWPT